MPQCFPEPQTDPLPYIVPVYSLYLSLHVSPTCLNYQKLGTLFSVPCDVVTMVPLQA